MEGMDSVIHFYENLPPDRRVAESSYEARLSLCRACPHLNIGTCMQCGCYVEVRAAQKGLRCPMGSW